MPNLLSVAKAQLEGTTQEWRAIDASLALTTAQAAEGVQSLQMTSTGATSPNVISSSDSVFDMVQVSTGSIYSGIASSRAATAGVTVDPRLQWFNNVGTFLSQTFGTFSTNSTTAWTQYNVTGATAPANAAYARLVFIVSTAAVGLVHYFDRAGIMTGSTTTWEAPPTPNPQMYDAAQFPAMAARF